MDFPGVELSIYGFSLKISGIVTLGGAALVAYYLSSEANQRRIVTALSNFLDKCGATLNNVVARCLIVEIQCNSRESFLQFLVDYELGNVEKRLSEEFSKLGIEEITVEIENREEVLRRREVIR